MNDKSQASSRKDGFGIGDNGDASMGTAGTSAGGTGSRGQDGGHKVEGAHGEEGHGALGRRSPADNQGLDGNIQSD